MNIEKEIFKRSHCDVSRLKKYGFVRTENGYSYVCFFLEDAFKAEIHIDDKGEVAGKVIETELDEEYLNLQADSYQGSFVAKVREEYIAILEDIRKNCFKEDLFLFPQTKAVAGYIQKTYKDKPEFLWKKYPGYAIFRNKMTQKWYAILMNIDASRIGLEKREVEIIDVKCDEAMIEELLKIEGFYPAYHMNKKKWITITLDGRVEDEIIFSMIDYSYSQIEKSDAWIVPANPKYYDVVGAFDHADTILWKQSSDIHPGDMIYLYVAEPYSSILYKCIAEETDIPYEYKDKDLSIRKVMKIRLLERYPEGKYSFAYLNTLGIKAVRGPRRLTESICEKLQ